LPETIISLKFEETLAILRTLDSEIDDLLFDFSQPGKLDLADFMENHFKFNLPMNKFGQLTGRSLNTFKRDFHKAFSPPPRSGSLKND